MPSSSHRHAASNTSKPQISIFVFFQAIQADPKHTGKLMVAEMPFHHRTQPKSAAWRCFQLQPRRRTRFYPSRNKPRWDERFRSVTGTPCRTP